MLKTVILMLALTARVSAFAAHSGAPSRWVSKLAAITTETAGEANTESYRLFFKSDGKAMSPWHDVPLEAGDGLYNLITEIPKMTKAKMEVATKEASNPIAQDIKKGKLRDYHGPIFWNYGCLPQTWENPNEEHPVSRCSATTTRSTWWRLAPWRSLRAA